MIDEANHWQSTKALSVYNVLVVKKTNALPAAHILAALQSSFLPRYEADDVLRGIEFLQAKGFVTYEGDVLAATHSSGPHKPVKLKRIKGDADLALDV